jgi:outer membrane protein assembly factor BamB
MLAIFSVGVAPSRALTSTAIASPAGTSHTLPSAQRWTVAIPARPAAPPVVSGPHVYLVLQSGVVLAYRVADGSVVWQREMRSDQPLSVDGDRVFVVESDSIQALNAADGTTAWRVALADVTAPLLAKDGWIIAASRGHLTAYRSADGTEVWKHESGPQQVRASIEGDTLYVPLDEGVVLSLDLKTGSERWRRRVGGAPAEVLALADRIYVGSANKRFYCLDAAGGEISWWFLVGSAVRGKPAADVNHVYLTAVDNLVRAFDRRSGALRWHADVKFRPAGGPVIVGPLVIVPGTSAQLRAWAGATGQPAGQIVFDEPLAVPPGFAESGGSVLMAAVTGGGVSGKWTLSLMGPELPVLTMAPITVLPGVVVPIQPPGR